MTLELHAWPTPNAFKVSIMLEECGLDFTAKPVNIGQGDQHTAEFRRMNPNAKMPVLVDTEGPDGQPITLFESGLILQYLAEKTDRFLAQSPQARYECLEWLMWQMAGFGPMLGQAHHFRIYAPERVEYAYDRYTSEAARLYNVLETRLSDSPYVSGAEYGIADMAVYPWATLHEKQGVNLADKPNIRKWLDSLARRESVQKGMEFMAEYRKDPDEMSEDERARLFGPQARRAPGA